MFISIYLFSCVWRTIVTIQDRDIVLLMCISISRRTHWLFLGIWCSTTSFPTLAFLPHVLIKSWWWILCTSGIAVLENIVLWNWGHFNRVFRYSGNSNAVKHYIPAFQYLEHACLFICTFIFLRASPGQPLNYRCSYILKLLVEITTLRGISVLLSLRGKSSLLIHHGSYCKMILL